RRRRPPGGPPGRGLRDPRRRRGRAGPGDGAFVLGCLEGEIRREPDLDADPFGWTDLCPPLRDPHSPSPSLPASPPPAGREGSRKTNKGGISLGCSPSSPGGRGGGWEKRAGVMRVLTVRKSPGN